MLTLAGFAEGLSAYDKKDYATAMREFKSLALQNNAKAQYNLGNMYEHGQGVERDMKEAVKWYRLAAGQGLAHAQYSLGLLFETQGLPGVPDVVLGGLKAAEIDFGVPQDYKVAMRWYRLAADQGFAPAESNLGGMYAKGQGVAPDYKEAVKWFRFAADKGYPLGMQNLGVCYKKGYGVAPSKIVAFALFSLAARSDQIAAQKRDELGKSMLVQELEAAQTIADYMHQSKSVIGPLTKLPPDAVGDGSFRLTDFKREFANLPKLDGHLNNVQRVAQ
ncbi:MAG: sel1 repeat family protein [Rhodoferax sp.]|nr:sel1 repeat family protein [Rhodoferax sp.]